MADTDKHRSKAMRRSFNKSLCITSWTEKKKKEERQKKKDIRRKLKKQLKTANKRSDKLEVLFNNYIKQIGDYYNHQALACRCNVSTITVKKWTYGYIPNRFVRWTIARYFASYLPVPASVIHADIQDTIDKWKETEQ